MTLFKERLRGSNFARETEGECRNRGRRVTLARVLQSIIDTFADATDDHQFIHVDHARAASETPFGGTIAHGFLVLRYFRP
jgi:acyl dehydratase